MSLGSETHVQESVNPENLQAELVKYLTTACRYVHRQGLTSTHILQIAEEALKEAEPVPVVFPFVPELLGKGVPNTYPRF